MATMQPMSRIISISALPWEERRAGLKRRILAEQRRAGDGFQRSLVPRSRFQPRLTPGGGLRSACREDAAFSVTPP